MQMSIIGAVSYNARREGYRASDLLMAVSVFGEENKDRIMNLAVAAMEELACMATEDEPLWQRDVVGGIEILNDIEYVHKFKHVDATLKDILRMVEIPNGNEYREGLLEVEASRESAFIDMNPLCLVDLLMDLKKWLHAFSSIVSRGMILGVLSKRNEGSYDGTLQVMTAEFHVPTPLVQVRESYFARYCKQLGCGIWGVVDVSMEDIFPNPITRYRTRPSGCLIQGMQNGCSKVIWVEHCEVDNRLVNNIFRPLLTSGFAFSAKRWIAALIRQCERIATLSTKTTPTRDGVLIPQAGRGSLLQLSERMMNEFCRSVSDCAKNLWVSLAIRGAEDVKVMTRNNRNEPGKPPGTTLVFATSVWLPSPPQRLFDFLRDVNNRSKWDILSYEQEIHELAYINKGKNPRNRVSILQGNAGPNEISILYLQESYTNITASYVTYAPIDIMAMSLILNGENPENVALLPSGFAIMPDRAAMNGEESDGSLLTVAFNIIDYASSDEYIPPKSVNTIYKVISETLIAVKAAIQSNFVACN